MTTRAEEKEAGGSEGNGTAMSIKEAEAERRREVAVMLGIAENPPRDSCEIPPRASGRNVRLTARHTATPQPERLHATNRTTLDVLCHILTPERALG